jgi:F420H(2)-dependent quinone reductase
MAGEFSAALRDRSEITVTVTGRVSGREISHVVWFVAGDGTVRLLPVRGSDTGWFRNLRAHPDLRLSAGQATLAVPATIITDPARVGEIVGEFRAKYGAGQIADYYPKTDVAVQADVS